MLCAQLDRVLKADIEDQMERTGAAGYKAYEYTENQQSWIAVERVSDEALLLRVDFLRRDGDVLQSRTRSSKAGSTIGLPGR